MPVLTSMEIREAVERGVELLDASVPDWRDKIDPTRLSMIDAHTCVLGQVFDEGPFAVESGYWVGCHDLGIWDDYRIETTGNVVRTIWLPAWYGFTVENLQDADALRAAWLRQLACVPA